MPARPFRSDGEFRDWFRLAELTGTADVGGLQSAISSAEFTLWRAYFADKDQSNGR